MSHHHVRIPLSKFRNWVPASPVRPTAVIRSAASTHFQPHTQANVTLPVESEDRTNLLTCRTILPSLAAQKELPRRFADQSLEMPIEVTLVGKTDSGRDLG